MSPEILIFILLLPLFLQGAAMFFDEFYFHRRRGLPLWERWGHPLDTLSVLICYLWVMDRPLNQSNLLIFVGLCAFSCLFVTKDEFVHKVECEAGEIWLHALLFVLHPIAFLSLGLIWIQKTYPIFAPVDCLGGEWPAAGIQGQMVLIGCFLFYQIFYWSFLWKKKIKVTR